MPESLKRMSLLVALLLGSLSSVLTFPGGVPAMIAAWCLLFTFLARNPRLAWFPIMQLSVILAFKQPHVGWGTITLSVAMFANLGLVLNAHRQLQRSTLTQFGVPTNRRLWIATACFWIGTAAVFWQWHETAHTSRRPTLDRARPIAVIGDSLSSGTQARYAYAARLQELVSVPVVDFARPGIESSEALADFPKLLAENPQCVVIQIGGHDFLKGKPRTETETNLRSMIEQARAADCEVILIEIARDVAYDPFYSLERQLANEYDLELLSDTWMRRVIFFSPLAPPGMWLSSKWHLGLDGVHPNAAGSQLLAEQVAAALERIYGEKVLQ